MEDGKREGGREELKTSMVSCLSLNRLNALTELEIQVC